jgi:hypothetical protein
MSIAVGDSGTILRTNDGGGTWTSQRSGTTNRLSGVRFFNATSGFVIGDRGTMLRTTNGGATWFPQSSGTSNTLCGITVNTGNTCVVVGDRGTILRTNVTGLITFAGQRYESSIPVQCSLAQNYPNPFNPSTAISYQLTAVSFVTLEVFDVLGRKVATLVDAIQTPGAHLAKWDGSALSSGVYFYRLRVRDAATGFQRLVETKKMLLMK